MKKYPLIPYPVQNKVKDHLRCNGKDMGERATKNIHPAIIRESILNPCPPSFGQATPLFSCMKSEFFGLKPSFTRYQIAGLLRPHDQPDQP